MKNWVKYKNNNSVKVSTEDCQDVDDFIKACKKELSPLLDSYAPAQLCLSTTADGPPLQPDDPIPAQNTAKNPLFISVANSSALQVPTLWRATGTITGARKMGFRRGMYRTAQTYLGFYEKRNGIKQDPFSYQDDGLLTINVLFKNEDNALHFRADVYEGVDRVSPQGYLALVLSADPASDAVLDEMILVGHYIHDDDSPPDTPGPLSVVTELYDTSPLFQYQRLERADLFGGRFKADRAHYNESARLLFPRLKDGSSVIGDLQAETFVYVKNPEEFRVCISWKNSKIDALWKFTPAVE